MSVLSSSLRRANRAIVYNASGDPAHVLRALTFPSLPPPPSNTLNIRYLLSPVNPADINVIEGVYPAKPSLRSDLTTKGLGSAEEPVFIAGNEGLAVVQDIGTGVTTVKKGDWVVMVKPQSGTWTTSTNVAERDIIKVSKGNAHMMSEVQAATMTVNPPTAFNMLHDFVRLQPGDWVVQNGANSSVGQAVIQIAAHRGIKTINLIRNRDDFASLKKRLLNLGGTQVMSYDELADKATRKSVKEWTSGKDIRLALNCVSGPTTTQMATLLGQNGCLVSYGAMSKQPLSLPTSLFIFKNIYARGFWQTRWYSERTTEERESVMGELVALMAQGKLKEPDHEIITLNGEQSDDEVTTKIRDAMRRLAQGQFGKKILFKFDDVDH